MSDGWIGVMVFVAAATWLVVWGMRHRKGRQHAEVPGAKKRPMYNDDSVVVKELQKRISEHNEDVLKQALSTTYAGMPLTDGEMAWVRNRMQCLIGAPYGRYDRQAEYWEWNSEAAEDAIVLLLAHRHREQLRMKATP